MNHWLRSMMRGPTLSPVAALCLACAPSQKGNFSLRQHRHMTAFLGSSDALSVSTTLSTSFLTAGLICPASARTTVDRRSAGAGRHVAAVANAARRATTEAIVVCAGCWCVMELGVWWACGGPVVSCVCSSLCLTAADVSVTSGSSGRVGQQHITRALGVTTPITRTLHTQHTHHVQCPPQPPQNSSSSGRRSARRMASAIQQPPAGEQRAAKQPRLDPDVTANVIIQFESAEGEHAGPTLDVPHTVTPQQLEVLLNGLLQNEEKQPYSFYIDGQELGNELGSHLAKNAVSVEQSLRVVYMPQAVFRVRPVARCTASMPGHSEAVLVVAFSPDGKQLATGSGDTTLRFWDLNTQLPRWECKGHRNWVLCMAWAPDGSMVASGDMDGNIWLWDPKTGKPLGTCKGHSKWITSLAWEPAHKALPARRFVSGSKDQTLRIWDAATCRCIYTMSSHTMIVTCVRWGGEGLVYSASRDGCINVWDAAAGKLVRCLKGHGHWVNTLALSTEAVLRSGAFDHTGAAPQDPAEAMQAAQQRYDAVVKGQPERLVSGSDDHTMFLWTPSTSKSHLARMTGHVQTINQVAFSPDGRWVLSASFDKSIKLWDGAKGTFVASFRGHVGQVFQVAWSSDSRLFVSGSKDSTLKVWDLRTRKLMVDLPGHADEVYAVDWSPDGSGVASGGKDQVVKLWRH